MKQEFRSGFITIAGCPNVGKSTLTNALVGEKIAIVSNKPQTTRSNIRGVVSGEDYQMVLIDTPGLHTPHSQLGEYMVRMANMAMDRVEAIVYMIDATHGVGKRDKPVLERLEHAKAPVFIAVNKIDIVSRESLVGTLTDLMPYDYVREVVPISASTGAGLETLRAMLVATLPEGPMYFPKDMITDQSERMLASEYIREKALRELREEVPHGIGVDIERFEDVNDDLSRIYAVIYCERPSHKAIIIGKNGAQLKKIGEQARKDLEWMLGRRVFLNLWVKVQPGWRDSQFHLRELGYSEE